MKTDINGCYTASTSSKLNEFISVVSDCLDNHNIGRELKWLFQRCYVRHVVSKCATVRQCFILTYPVSNPAPDQANPFSLVAIAYVQLRNGQIYGLELTGEVERGIAKINAIGAWLNEQIYEDARFTSYETYLARMINCSDSESQTCELKVFRYASIGPCPPFLLAGLIKICFAILSLSPGKYRLDKVEQVSKAVDTYFPEFSCAEELIASFARNLDIPVMGLLEELSAQFGAQLLSLHAYNYFVAGDTIRKRNRLQAVRELPWLTPLLIRIAQDKWKFSALTRVTPEVCSAKRQYWARTISTLIDGGQPLFANVAAIFKVDRKIIKWSKHRSLYLSKFFTPERTEHMLALLAAIRCDIRPKNEQDWSTVESILVALARFPLPFHGDQNVMLKFLSGQETIEDVFAHPLTQEIFFNRFSELGQMKLTLESSNVWLHERLAEVCDFWNALRSAIRWHCYDYLDSHGKNANHISTVVNEWLRTQTLQQIVKLSGDWHTAIHSELENVFAEKYGIDVSGRVLAKVSEWPVVLKEPFILGDRKFTELSNKAELIQEGRLMRHCIGSYSEKCAQGNALIFSVVDSRDVKLTTLELEICNKTGRLNLVSHKGFRNANPSKECQAAALVLVKHLNAEDFAMSVKNRRCFQKSRRAISDEINLAKTERKNQYQRMTQRIAWQCCFGGNLGSGIS